jgi:hypothetical protein
MPLKGTSVGLPLHIKTRWLTLKLEIVARCPKSGEEACRFFLWEKDEAAARASMTTEVQPPQQPEQPQLPVLQPTLRL